MAAISDYLEKKLLNFIFRGGTFDKIENISVALLNSIPKDNDTGATMDEVPEKITNDAGAEVFTQYQRYSLGKPLDVGNSKWTEPGQDGNSAYYVYSETSYLVDDTPVAGSGYFYPLYLLSSKAQSSGNGSFTSLEFNEHPGVTFYKPDNVGALNSATNPDPTQIIYRFYDGNGFIQNSENITFNQAGSGGWGTIEAVALMDSSVHGEGQIIMYAPLEVPKPIGQGDVVQFIPSQLEISLK